MDARNLEGSPPQKTQQDPERRRRVLGATVNAAVNRGFVLGCEVLIGSVPGIVVGYNIANFGRFAGNPCPLVVRTARGVTQCAVDEVRLV